MYMADKTFKNIKHSETKKKKDPMLKLIERDNLLTTCQTSIHKTHINNQSMLMKYINLLASSSGTSLRVALAPSVT